jgi:hypothetical protein
MKISAVQQKKQISVNEFSEREGGGKRKSNPLWNFMRSYFEEGFFEEGLWFV